MVLNLDGATFMSAIQMNKKENLTYKDKTNFPGGTGADIFIRGFFTEEDVGKLREHVFKDDQFIDLKNLQDLLNNVVSFIATGRLIRLKPGRADKKELIDSICDIAENLDQHLNILINQYGYETFKHIPIISREGYGWNDHDTYQYIIRLKEDLLKLAHVCDVIKRGLDKESGNKTGDNSQNAIPRLIYYLVQVYEQVTSKNAKENFKQATSEEPPYKGQFYDFVRMVFVILNENYKIRYPKEQT